MRRLHAALPIALALSACAASEAPAEPSKANLLALSGVHHESFREGRPAVHARIDALTVDRGSGHIEATGITLSDGATHRVTLAAQRADGSTKGPDATLSGGVVLTGSAGEKLETAACALDLAHDAVTGRETTTLTTPDLTARADGFSATLGQSPRLQLEGRVHAASPFRSQR